MDEEQKAIDRILAMSDEEIEADLRAQGLDPEEEARKLRALFEHAVTCADWQIDLVAFRMVLGGIDRQDLTIKELRRMLLGNGKTGLGLVGTPAEIAAYINSLPKLEY